METSPRERITHRSPHRSQLRGATDKDNVIDFRCRQASGAKRLVDGLDSAL